ncbi:peptidoglycan editing factor PgeF [Bacillus testis]|uniref:peptidoglycan editing factor PgeF n=1 Tax=Bacillus testis TaxID=1622072 RepID=UPI00067E904D|nr:peptidoglycan editing factor PgeF [Bacillus testis]
MEEIFSKKDQTYFHIPEWEKMDPSLVAGFTTKNGGISEGAFSSLNTGYHVGDEKEDVVKNRTIVGNKIGMPLGHWVGCEQTHGKEIIKVTKEMAGRGAYDYETALKNTDGLYTDEEGILLTLCFADCVPIYYFAPKQRYIGIVHAGWKGTVKGIAGEMAQRWINEGVEPSDIFVAIGPSICEKCYIVDDKVIGEVNKRLEGKDKKPYNLIKEGQYSLNLQLLNKQIMESAGLKNIAVTELCTSCGREDFFSYRRDAGKTGRLMSFIGWKEAARK